MLVRHDAFAKGSFHRLTWLGVYQCAWCSQKREKLYTYVWCHDSGNTSFTFIHRHQPKFCNLSCYDAFHGI